MGKPSGESRWRHNQSNNLFLLASLVTLGSLARYDLLVNKFLTSKIANKGLHQVHEFLLNQEALAKAKKVRGAHREM